MSEFYEKQFYTYLNEISEWLAWWLLAGDIALVIQNVFNCIKQHSAVAARGAHNPEVTRSRRVAAIRDVFLVFFFSFFFSKVPRTKQIALFPLSGWQILELLLYNNKFQVQRLFVFKLSNRCCRLVTCGLFSSNLLDKDRFKPQIT